LVDNDYGTPTYRPLMSQVCRSLFVDTGADLHDLQVINSGALSGLFSGFSYVIQTAPLAHSLAHSNAYSPALHAWICCVIIRCRRFGFQAKKRPTDNRTILLFVIGGISCQEIADIAAALQESESGGEYELLVGSTQITNGDRVYDMMFQALNAG
jgi:hypothetical protein